MEGDPCLELVVVTGPRQDTSVGGSQGQVPNAYMGHEPPSSFLSLPIPPPPSPPQLLLASPPSQTSSVCSRRGQNPERKRLGFIWWLPGPEEAAIAENTPTDFVLHSLSPGRPQRTTSRGHGEQRLRNPIFGGLGFLGEELRGGKRDRKQRNLLDQGQEEGTG